jgi:hypothetical protein
METTRGKQHNATLTLPAVRLVVPASANRPQRVIQETLETVQQVYFRAYAL